MARDVVVALTLVAGAPTVRAEVSLVARARELSDTGRAAHDRGDYARAIAAFKEAYVIAPVPGLLFNLAQAYRLQGACDDAAIMYRRYLSTHPAAERRALARAHLETVERCARPVAHPPPDLAAAYAGALEPPAQRALTGDADRDRPGRFRQELGVGVAIGGGAALALATYYGFRASAAERDVERAYAMGARWRDVAARHRDGERAATIARVLGIGGVAGIATGVTLYVLGKRAERAAPVVTPTAGGGAQVSIGWQF